MYARHKFVRDLHSPDLVLSIQGPILGLAPSFERVDNWRNQLNSRIVIQGVYPTRCVVRNTERKPSLTETVWLVTALSPHFLVSAMS